MSILSFEKALQRVKDMDATHLVDPWCHCGEPLDVTDVEWSNGNYAKYRCPVCKNSAGRYSPMSLCRPCGADPIEPSDDENSAYFTSDLYTA